MDDGMVVQISHLLVRVSLLLPGGFKSRARRTFALLHNLALNVRHSRLFEQLLSGQVVKDEKQYEGIGTP